MLDKKQVLSLIDRVGCEAFSAEVNEDGTVATLVVTTGNGNNLENLLGKDNVRIAGFVDGRRAKIEVNIEALAEAAANKKRVSRGSAVTLEITSSVQYDVVTKTEDAPNLVTSAWWSSKEMSGGITVNGVELEIAPGFAKDHYEWPVDGNGNKDPEWNPERTVYIVDLTVTDEDGLVSTLTLTSYGVTNLIRRVASRNEKIG